MVFRLFIVCLLLIPIISFANGRKPAVEDFVGVEVEESEVAPQGTESLYNLQQDISKIEAQKYPPKKAESQTIEPEKPISTQFIAGLIFAISLPLSVLFLVMARMKKKASLESAANIEVLERYRKEREKKSEEARKAS